MKAIVIKESGGPEVLVVEEKPTPEFGAGEVLVNVKYTSVNRADVIQRKGFYPAPKGVVADIPGLEYAGVVSKVSDEITDFKPGDKVFGLVPGGSYAEYIVAHHRTLARIPDNLSMAEAAAIPEAYTTAYDAMVCQSGLSAGEWVLISAVGSGVGTAAVQIAKAIGARSIGTSRTADKLKHARELGLDHGIHTEDGKFAEQVNSITDGRGVDLVLELVGGPYFQEDLDCVRYQGRIIIVGLLAGRKVECELGKILGKRINVRGTTLRSRPLEQKILAGQTLQNNIAPLVEKGLLKPLIDKEFKIEDASKAHEYMESNKNFGTIVLKVSD